MTDRPAHDVQVFQDWGWWRDALLAGHTVRVSCWVGYWGCLAFAIRAKRITVVSAVLPDGSRWTLKKGRWEAMSCVG